MRTMWSPWGVHGTCGGLSNTANHQHAFEAIKVIIVSRECLTVIDHRNMGENKVFVMCDVSDWWMGATPVLQSNVGNSSTSCLWLYSTESHGELPCAWERIVGDNTGTQKWCSDLLGIPIHVYTDHRTLEKFDTQRNLSRRQLRWQEFMSQYNMMITYIRGRDNTIADILSWVAPNAFPDEQPELCLLYSIWLQHPPTIPVGAILSIATDHSVLEAIHAGYETDEFCLKNPWFCQVCSWCHCGQWIDLCWWLAVGSPGREPKGKSLPTGSR